MRRANEGLFRWSAVAAAAGFALAAAPARADVGTVDAGPTWSVQSSAVVPDNGDAISQPGYAPSDWLTTDTVDWNQRAPDGLTGAQFPIQLRTTKAVELDDVHVLQSDAADLSTADLTVKATLRNTTGDVQAVELGGAITQAQDQGTRGFDTDVALNPGESRTVKFTPDAYPSLHVTNPHVWWPYDMGGQPLYDLSVTARLGDAVMVVGGVR